MQAKDILLLVTPLSQAFPEPMIDRAATVADHLEQSAVVFCPVPADSSSAGRGPGWPAETNAAIAQAQQHAMRVAAALNAKGIAAEARAETCLAESDAIVAIANRVHAGMLMLSARQYSDWAESRARGASIERLGIPIWVDNDGPIEGVVLGALPTQDAAARDRALDDEIAMYTKRLADSFQTEAHLLDTIQPEPALKRAVGLITGTDGSPDSAPTKVEANRVARAHETADRWRIPKQHVHIHHAEFLDDITHLSETMKIGLVVLESGHKRLITRLLSPSAEQQLLGALRADLLVVRH